MSDKPSVKALELVDEFAKAIRDEQWWTEELLKRSRLGDPGDLVLRNYAKSREQLAVAIDKIIEAAKDK